MKDGPKNRLRAQDIHKIVDVFNRQREAPRYSRMVPVEEIERNDFNLNLPRYIDSQQAEDLQDIEGHLRGGIPTADVDALQPYWAVCPELRQALFRAERPGYLALAIDKAAIKCEAILIPGEGGIGSIFHYISGRFDLHQRVYGITQFLQEISGKYVYLHGKELCIHAMQNSVKATVDSLRLPTFQNFEIALPPTFQEQTAIAAVLSDMDAEIAALEAKLAKARQVKQGMMQELLTGRIRLVGRDAGAARDAGYCACTGRPAD